MGRLRAPLAALGVLALAVGGCGAGSGASPGGARLLVTDDFGRTALVRDDDPELRGSDTVMRLLQRNATVATRYGGGFVQSIDGRAGGQRDGRPIDWLVYVDGVLSDQGAAQVRVRDGTAVWWDRHDWGSGPGSGSAVVGSFPAPFGRRAALACVPAASAACTTARKALARAGARVQDVPPAAVGRGEVPAMLVGTLTALRSSAPVRLLREGPSSSGVYARPARDGRSVALLDERGRRAATATAGGGLVAATRVEGQAPVWTVTGTDEAGVSAAARALTAERLRSRFALAVGARTTTALPVDGT